MMKVLSAVLLALVASGQLVAGDELHEQDITKVEWWRKTNFYHIYIRSFKDSNGDGSGDLRGVISSLDYLKLIGVETLLLSPFYSSPMKDGGYDIDDYTAMNELFGSMEDFELLVSELKRRSMRIVIDFVPNHSSNKHKWFWCSERALIEPECAKYKDYYVWANSTRYNNQYPTNWLSIFGGGSAWEWSPIRKEFYLHQFLTEQPELNLRNSAVREEFKEINRFWYRKGVDGLRVDAAPHFYEDTEEWRDEPANPDWVETPWNKYASLIHIYTCSLPGVEAVMGDWHQVGEEPEFSGEPKVILAESYADNEAQLRYYGANSSARYADLPFYFGLLSIREPMRPATVVGLVTDWLEGVLRLGWPRDHGAIMPWTCWVTGNHDNHRLVNRLGKANSDAYKWIAYLLPGSPVLYYGDELPIQNADYTRISAATMQEGEMTRLIARVSMAWSSASPSAGFSTNSSTWMPLDADYEVRNVETMLASESKNELKNFIQLQSIRRKFIETLTFGDLVFYETRPVNTTLIFAMARLHDSFGQLLMLANFDETYSESVHLFGRKSLVGGEWSEPPQGGKVLMLNYIDETSSTLREGNQVELQGLVLAPNQAAILSF